MAFQVCFCINYGLILLSCAAMAVLLSGVKPDKDMYITIFFFYVFSGCVQLLVYMSTGHDTTWKLIPFLTHIPLLLLICLKYRKHFTTALASVTYAYMFTQPSLWIGLFFGAITGNFYVEYIARIITTIVTFISFYYFVLPYVSQMFQKKPKEVLIFSMVPCVYYVFDYAVGVYTDLWGTNPRLVNEFLPFFLCIVYTIFCIVYYREYEIKKESQTREEMIQLTLDMQAKEIEAVKRNNREFRLLRHDMRFYLNEISMSLAKNDIETAQKVVESILGHIDSMSIKSYSPSNIINYVISSVSNKCTKQNIHLDIDVKVRELTMDEIMLSSIIENALDNAIIAQKGLPDGKRNISFMMKESKGRLLVSVKNTYGKPPVFKDGMPISKEKGHGYGTQSINTLVERLNGSCQFYVSDNQFVMRAII